jgi:hypothetical protein
MSFNPLLNGRKFWAALLLPVAIGTIVNGCSFKVSTAGLDNVKMCAQEPSNSGCATDTTNFKPNTGKLFVTANLNNAPEGTKVKIEWKFLGGGSVAPQTIDTVTLETKANTNLVNSYLSSPNNGWPKGDYEVVISLDTDNSKPVSKKFSISS